jgi:hypothetical protein
MAAGAVDHDLRGIGDVAEAMAIAVLTRGRRFQRERVLPAEPVPIGDTERQRQHITKSQTSEPRHFQSLRSETHFAKN